MEHLDNLLGKLETHFKQSGQTLALAESCTGGLISSLVTRRPGVSQFFLGSVVSYAATVKKDVLGVRSSSIECHGEVSVPVATEMARGARKVLKSSWSVSVTGIAGPTGGSKEKPVGTVCFAVVGPGFEEAKMQHFKSGSRHEIQLESAIFALEFLWDSIHAYKEA
jgi:PncC family amidohydrolase